MRIDSPNWAEELGEVRKLFAAQLLANDLAGLEEYRRQRNGS